MYPKFILDPWLKRVLDEIKDVTHNLKCNFEFVADVDIGANIDKKFITVILAMLLVLIIEKDDTQEKSQNYIQVVTDDEALKIKIVFNSSFRF